MRTLDLLPRRLGSRPLHLISLIALVVALGLGSTACGGAGSQHSSGSAERPYTKDDVAKNAHALLPSYVTPDLQESYEFALAHPDALEHMPCYCGCGLTSEHRNNLDCYIAGADKNGDVVFDNHASFCAICVEIAQDVKRLGVQGKSTKEIRAYIDETHGPKGPGTNTPLPSDF